MNTIHSILEMEGLAEAYVIKRDGRKEVIDYNKISRRLEKLKKDVEQLIGRTLRVSIFRITQSTIRQIYDGITTSELDEEAAEVAAEITDDPDYGDFAGAILMSNLEANNRDTMGFSAYGQKAYFFVEEKTGEQCPLISKQVFDISQKYGHLIDRQMVMHRNLSYGYFACKTLMKGGYLLGEHRTVQKNRMKLHMLVPFETPQHALMRVSLGIHGPDLNKAFELYDYLSRKTGTMATPTLFFAGTPRPQLSSCFLLAMKSDSLPGIYDTLKDCAMISKDAGGIGLHIHNIRSTGSYIKGTNGTSNGLVPMLRVFNNTAKYVDQCFHPDTLVYTKTGYKHMCDIVYNDQVLTSDGTFRDVLKILHHDYDGPVCEIVTSHSISAVTVTPEHPVFAIQGVSTEPDPNKILAALEHGTLIPEYVEVEKLRVGDMIGVPIPTYVKDVPHLSLDDCRMLGLLLRREQNESRFCVDASDPDDMDFIRTYLKSRLISFQQRDERIWWKHVVGHAPFPITRAMLTSDFFLHLPTDKIEAILLGYGPFHWYQDRHCFLLSYLYLRLGKTFDEEKSKSFVHQNILYSRIQSTEYVYEYHGTMIDFEIDGNHNYTTELGLSHNGGGKRAGSFAMYLEPWHADILEFLDLKKPNGAEDQRARDLFYALWVPDLFFKRIKEGLDTAVWSLMDPRQSPGLSDVWGEEFEALYTRYESEGKFVKQIPVRQLVEAILTSQIETGTPYILAKDACNRKSNQKNLGTIKSSNLCVTRDTEILTLEYGTVPIVHMVNKTVSVWNGTEWSMVEVLQTSDSSEIMRVVFDMGNGEERHIDCTLYHKFFIEGVSSLLEAYQLTVGMRVSPYALPDGTCCPSVRVKNVIHYEHRFEPTYCFNEPLRHAGIFNGVLAGNCTEIVEYSSPTETAVCTLASLSLPAFVTPDKTFDYVALSNATRVFVRALNRVIDINHYPLESARLSNMRHRPMGLGVQGLADVFCRMNLRFGSAEAKVVNRRIAETMYFAAMTESHLLAIEEGPYPSIDENGGAPIRHGIFQFDMWKDELKDFKPDATLGYDWEELRSKVVKDGVRNSLLIAPMPTASTSIILGNIESFEPYYSMMFVRSTKSGEFFQMCRPLVEELIRRGLWEVTMDPKTKKSIIPIKEKIMASNGSIQDIAEIPQDMKDVFVCITDIKLKDLTEMARDRGLFTCQSQSLNVHFRNKENMKTDLLRYMLFAWELGLKTISYYTRTIQSLAALNFTGNTMKKMEKDCVLCTA